MFEATWHFSQSALALVYHISIFYSVKHLTAEKALCEPTESEKHRNSRARAHLQDRLLSSSSGDVLTAILVAQGTCHLDPLSLIVVSYVPGELSTKLPVTGLHL